MTVTDIDTDVFHQIVTDEELAPPCQNPHHEEAVPAEWILTLGPHECGLLEQETALICTPCKDMIMEIEVWQCAGCGAPLLLKDYVVSLEPL